MNAESTAPHIPAVFRTRWFWFTTIILVIVLGGIWILLSGAMLGDSTEASSADLSPAPVAGHPAPDFELKSLNGEIVRLSDFAGKPVLISFWATWCGPCRSEFPDFQEASVENAEALVIIGINHTTADRVELVGDFVAEMGATFPIVLDETGQTAETYQVRGLPTSIFVDKNGIVNEVFAGPIDKAYIESKIDELSSAPANQRGGESINVDSR
ncbi:MAG: redoxin domain-containing protein [Anaerolineae bacterium]|nr:redoxin domain-containing protein [Anaerolineae bacterium]